MFTHQTRLAGKQIAFLVSGPLRSNENAREILRAYSEVMRGHLVDIVSDEVIADSPDGVSALNAAIDTLARRVAEGVDRVAQPPVSFRGVAGLRLFRDEIFGGLGFVFQADDRYYRKHGLYDFPQRRYGRRLQSAFMTLLTKIPGLRQEIRNRLQGELVKPYRKVVAAVDDS